ncbi:hypothetical protein LTR56_005933 [Elasticomyces elasticus]|nr:hypothetical protein LTR22_012447 [Elasticomyces elasticus]KAK3651169.1 hypothetical protein LTR56_005933 [Elasticomyces elasticus]KAK5741995.1 hypothetical protein LTS12_024408 [Elasticomyces elasticus]
MSSIEGVQQIQNYDTVAGASRVDVVQEADAGLESTRLNVYKALQADEIRILTLQDGEGTEPLRGFLDTLKLSDEPFYYAISYVWGQQDFSGSITLDYAQEVKLHSSLLGALRHYRNYFRKMRRCSQVWIDSICIDQSSNEDKDQQVQLMSKIYGQAVEVFVWLGDAHPDDDLAFEMLRSIPWIWHRGRSQYSIEGQGPLINEARFNRMRSMQIRDAAPPTIKTALLAVRSVLQRPYFRRLWPVQEVILAVVVTINAGCESCEWGQLCQAVEVLESLNVEGIGLSGFPVPPQIDLLRRQNPFPPWPLPYLFYVTLPLGTSEDKDHIFALRGLVATNDRDAFRGTYDQVSPDLFQRLTLYLLGYSTLKEPCAFALSRALHIPNHPFDVEGSRKTVNYHRGNIAQL